MRKKILSFMMLLIVAFCFVGCKDESKEESVLVVDGKEVIATINGVNYTADQVYDSLVSSNISAEYLYEQLEDLLIKTAVPVTDSMRSRIVNEVEKWDKDIKENATISGTSYKDALAEALEEEGVASKDELIEKKIFALQEEIITNEYWTNAKENYYKEYLNNYYVYHVSQILVGVSTSGNTDYFNVSVSEDTAEKLANVVDSLISGESFYNVALRYSDDSNSKNNGGDLGLVTLNDTSISDEVKYALASYSTLFENASLGIPNYVNEAVYGNGIEAIPQIYITKLSEEADKTDSNITSTGSDISSSSRFYTRSIIFNNLFNSRTFRFLQSDGTESVKSYDNIRMPLTAEAGFASASTQNVVVNESGIPILVVRSDSGIHFLSITKSAFVGEDELLKYYSKEVDNTDGYKNYLEKAIDESDYETRLEELEGFAEEYAIMKVSDNSDFAGNEDFIRYDMFESYLGGTYSGVKFEIKNEKIKNVIEQYINAQKEYVKTKISNVFSEGYLSYSNSAEYADSLVIKKEIPILQCLDNKGCTYTYKDGFKAYSSGGGE